MMNDENQINSQVSEGNQIIQTKEQIINKLIKLIKKLFLLQVMILVS